LPSLRCYIDLYAFTQSVGWAVMFVLEFIELHWKCS